MLWHGYKVLFHSLPPVLLKPWELTSCTQGSLRARALQEEVSKMLQRGTLEPVDQLGPVLYSQLFLVEKVTGAGDLSSTCQL